ncbi:hypothetical protein CKJ89_38060, partial [Klebsiella pneumoniae]
SAIFSFTFMVRHEGMKEKKEDIHYLTRELHAKNIQKIGSKVTICAPWSTVTIVHIYNNLRSVFHHFLLLFLTESGIF